MSQAGINSSSGGGGGGGTVNEIDSQDGNATALAGVIIINAYDIIENNDNGIETKAGVAGGDPDGNPPVAGAINEVDVYLTNRLTGTATTGTNPGNTDATIISFDLGATPGTYYVYGNVQAFDPNTPAGGGFSFSGAYRTTGSVFSGIELGKEFHDDFKSLSFQNADIDLTALSNHVILTVQGLSLVPIRWNAVMEYRRVL